MVASLRAFLILGMTLAFVTGVVYPWGVTRLAGLLFPRQAQGSLVVQDGRPTGSWLIAQPWSGEGFFQSRGVSASGVDPHITPAAALAQVPAVARARGMDPAIVESLVNAAREPREAGVFGVPRVNVLRLNLSLKDAGVAAEGSVRP